VWAANRWGLSLAAQLIQLWVLALLALLVPLPRLRLLAKRYQAQQPSQRVF
jgi:hypothetical protein